MLEVEGGGGTHMLTVLWEFLGQCLAEDVPFKAKAVREHEEQLRRYWGVCQQSSALGCRHP